MSTAQHPEPSPKPATVEDMIGWLGEQALHTGQFGPTTWCPQEICNIASRRCVSGSSAAAPISDEIDINTALGYAITDWHRDKYLANVIHKNRGLMEETTKVVHERLLGAGMREEDLQQLNERNVGIRMKIARLQELQTYRLQPRAEERFAIWLMTEENGAMKKMKVFLPRRGSFGHFLAVSRDIWLAQQFPNVELVQDYNFGAGAWIYRLVNKHSQIVSGTPRVKLTDEFDYREMVEQITREGTETPTAIFWHESTVETGDKIVRKQEKAEDKVENEEMGDDENPYFQPVDWKFLIQDRHRQGQGCSHNRSPSTRSTDVEVNRAM